MLLKVWSLNQPRQHRLKMFKFSDFTTDLLKPWGGREEPPSVFKPSRGLRCMFTLENLWSNGVIGPFTNSAGPSLHPAVGRMGFVSHSSADGQTEAREAKVAGNWWVRKMD